MFVLLHPYISGIFLRNVHLHGLIQFPKYSQFHTWYLQNKMYATNPHTLEELKASIRHEIDYISELN